jgi:hypothetical protein
MPPSSTRLTPAELESLKKLAKERGARMKAMLERDEEMAKLGMQTTMTSTKTPVSTLMDRQQRHDFAMNEAEEYVRKNPKAPPPKKETEKK